jgi:ubiquinone/menaquinone biosynthesis C-methylase UbiE
VRRAWAVGDYHRFATDLIWRLGVELVSACGIRPADRVLDVAAGSGNVALRAAEAGATVVASDLAPENLAAGRRAAQRAGLPIDWVEADAEDLPFADAQFDVVTCNR